MFIATLSKMFYHVIIKYKLNKPVTIKSQKQIISAYPCVSKPCQI